MTRSPALALALLLAASAAAADVPRPPAGTPARHAAARAHARAGAPADAARAPRPATAALPRTLEDVHIEGEIPVPQVLFITARDQRRFMDAQPHRYLKTSRQLGEDTAMPSWILVAPARDPQERSRHHE